VWERSLALDRSPGKKKKADLDPLASEEVQRAAADLRESVVAAVAVLEHQRGQTEMLKDMDQKRKNLRDGKSEAIEFGSVQYAANETVSAKDTLAPTIVETKPQDKDQQVVSSVV
ncbi:MAG: hypothetical protein MRY32_05130, partial [Rickettsiales bacterium]|nr:hypothetical protein [Rickettsiales bacterium]